MASHSKTNVIVMRIDTTTVALLAFLACTVVASDTSATSEAQDVGQVERKDASNSDVTLIGARKVRITTTMPYSFICIICRNPANVKILAWTATRPIAVTENAIGIILANTNAFTDPGGVASANINRR